MENGEFQALRIPRKQLPAGDDDDISQAVSLASGREQLAADIDRISDVSYQAVRDVAADSLDSRIEQRRYLVVGENVPIARRGGLFRREWRADWVHNGTNLRTIHTIQFEDKHGVVSKLNKAQVVFKGPHNCVIAGVGTQFWDNRLYWVTMNWDRISDLKDIINLDPKNTEFIEFAQSYLPLRGLSALLPGSDQCLFFDLRRMPLLLFRVMTPSFQFKYIYDQEKNVFVRKGDFKDCATNSSDEHLEPAKFVAALRGVLRILTIRP